MPHLLPNQHLCVLYIIALRIVVAGHGLQTLCQRVMNITRI